jgi:3,4-dihydroxy 2-butanone 4-phosphate synthase/GTP cyclohydrolase II
MNGIEHALNALRDGQMIVVTDDDNRENEGDLICAARYATPEVLNFMAKYARGLICMPMSRKYTKKLGLSQMVARNTDHNGTAFTVSIDHRDCKTGISAFERSYTAMKVACETVTADDFIRPGHMFPLEAVDGGVLMRPGHTEATVDFMRLANLEEVGLCVEIMADDGHMMRRDELVTFAQKHHLVMTTIDELSNYMERQKQ